MSTTTVNTMSTATRRAILVTPVGRIKQELLEVMQNESIDARVQYILSTPAGGSVLTKAKFAANFSTRQDVIHWLQGLVLEKILPSNFLDMNRGLVTGLWYVAQVCEQSKDKEHAGEKAALVAKASEKKTNEKDMPNNDVQIMFAMWHSTFKFPLTPNKIVSSRGLKKLSDMMSADGHLFVAHTIKDFKIQSKVLAIKPDKEKLLALGNSDSLLAVDDDEEYYKTDWIADQNEFWNLLRAYLNSMVAISLAKDVRVKRQFSRKDEEDPFFTMETMSRYLTFVEEQAEMKHVSIGNLVHGEEQIRIQIMNNIRNANQSKQETFDDTACEWPQWGNIYFKPRDTPKVKKSKGGKKGGDPGGGGNTWDTPPGKPKPSKKNPGGKNPKKGATPKKVAKGGKKGVRKYDKDNIAILKQRVKGEVKKFKGDPDKAIYGEGPWGKCKEGEKSRKHGEKDIKVHALLHESACPFHHGPKQDCKFKDICHAGADGHKEECGARLANGAACGSKNHTSQQHFRAHEDGLTGTM